MRVADHALRNHGGAVVTASVQSQEAFLHADVIYSRTVQFGDGVVVAYIVVGDIDIHVGIHSSALCRLYSTIFKVIDDTLHPVRT